MLRGSNTLQGGPHLRTGADQVNGEAFCEANADCLSAAAAAIAGWQIPG